VSEAKGIVFSVVLVLLTCALDGIGVFRQGEKGMIMGWLDVVTGQSRVLLEEIIKAAPVSMFAVDTEHRVIAWNEACAELTGKKCEEMVGSTDHWKAFYRDKRPCLADIVIDGHFNLLAEMYSVVTQSRVAGRGWRVEDWFELPSGRRRYLVVSASPVYSEDGKLLGAVETAQDATELKSGCEEDLTREEREQRSQKMEAISRMAGGIAHDFNNLLTAILGYSRLLRENLGEAHPLCADVDEIVRAGDKGAQLTKQLLAISRKQVMKPHPVNLGGVLADVLPVLRQRAGQKIQIQSECDRELWNIQADVSLLEEVIYQLFSNARDAMPSGGSVSIRLGNIVLDDNFCRGREGAMPGRYVLLTFADTGCGMPPEVRSHLFEPFFTTKDRGRGCGLGLSVIYGILRQMGAFVDVETEINIGSRFLVYFPVSEKDAQVVSEKKADEEAPKGSETVLVVEDEDIVRHLVVLMLKSLGYRVLEASDGREALKIAKRYEGRIHIVLTDVVMPHIGGLDLVKQLRPIRRDFKVLYTSGFTDGRLLDQGLLDGEYQLILKPYTRESLARKVRDVLDAKTA